MLHALGFYIYSFFSLVYLLSLKAGRNFFKFGLSAKKELKKSFTKVFLRFSAFCVSELLNFVQTYTL